MSVCRMTKKRIGRPDGPHHLILEGQGSSSPGSPAWREVESFDENQIVMYTTKGTLVVRGETCTLRS